MSRLTHRPAAIVVLKSKADAVRQLAAEHGFAYKEAPVLEREDAVRFYFAPMDDATTRRLLSIIPRDVYAYHAVVGARGPGDNIATGLGLLRTNPGRNSSMYPSASPRTSGSSSSLSAPRVHRPWDFSHRRPSQNSRFTRPAAHSETVSTRPRPSATAATDNR